MISYEKVRKEMEKTLSPKRYLHSLRVVAEASKLAKQYKLDSKRMRLSCLTHDCTKGWSRMESIAYLESHHIKITEEDKLLSAVLHGKVAATWCKQHYDFDENMCKAIFYHTTGHRNMNDFAKVLFLADKIEEHKKYEGVCDVRKLAYQNLDEAILLYLNIKIKKAMIKGMLLHSDTFYLQNDLQNQLFCQKLYWQTQKMEQKHFIKRNYK